MAECHLPLRHPAKVQFMDTGAPTRRALQVGCLCSRSRSARTCSRQRTGLSGQRSCRCDGRPSCHPLWNGLSRPALRPLICWAAHTLSYSVYWLQWGAVDDVARKNRGGGNRQGSSQYVESWSFLFFKMEVAARGSPRRRLRASSHHISPKQPNERKRTLRYIAVICTCERPESDA